MKKSLALAFAPLAILALAGCGSAESAPPAPATTEASSEQPEGESMGGEPQDDIPEEDMQEGLAPDDGVQGGRSMQDGVATFAFGDDATYPTGQGLKVSYVEDTKLSEYGAGDCSPGDPVSVFKVTVKNDTGARWDPWADLIMAASYVEEETGEAIEAGDVFDEYGGKSLDGGQSLPALMDGKSGSSYVGFCHPGGSADSVQVYGTFYGEYGEPAGDALWMTADSIE